MSPFEFTAVLKRPEGTGTWTYLDIPLDVFKTFGSRGQVKVRGMINGQPYRGVAQPHGDGTHYLVVNSSIRNAIGVSQGDLVSVTFEADTAERTVVVPEDFQQVLDAHLLSKAVFERLSYSHRKEYVQWFDEAKRAETRQKRIAKAMEMLLKGNTPKRNPS